MEPTDKGEQAAPRYCTDDRHNPDNPCIYDGCAACESECDPPPPARSEADA
jgi:hypothetical protein